MLKFCTIADSSYLLKGLSLLKSLSDHVEEEFMLYWLCLDDDIYAKLSDLNLQHVVLFRLEELENADPLLRVRKQLMFVSDYGDQRDNYIWSLTPYFIHYILQNKMEQYGEPLMYVDSDIMFYQSPQAILKRICNNSLGIHTHRFSGSYTDDNAVGWFNVGVVVVRNGHPGAHMLALWTNWLLNPYNEYAEKYGRCGDQGYLGLLYKMFMDDVAVFDECAPWVHMAPWCTHNPEDLPILFYHFSHYREENGQWYDSVRGEWNPAQIPHIQSFYENYFNTQQELKKRFNL